MPDNLHNPLSDSLDQKIAAALATPPHPHIPPGFSARIAAEAQARFGSIPQPPPASQFGSLAIRIALAALLLAMFLLARTFPHLSPLTFALQATLAAEFILVALYLARPTLTLR